LLRLSWATGIILVANVYFLMALMPKQQIALQSSLRKATSLKATQNVIWQIRLFFHVHKTSITKLPITAL